jgi:ABC-type phosphate transport system substrate-binding protein
VRRSAPIAIVAFVGLAAVVGLAGHVAAAADPSFRVIVHPDVSGTQVPRAILSSIFLKDVQRWGDGSPVAPVDQSMASPVRAAFSERVLGRPVEGVQFLWHQKMIKGVAPPPVKSSDADVIAFVAERKGAIGYVTADTPLPSSVKALKVVD